MLKLSRIWICNRLGIGFVSFLGSVVSGFALAEPSTPKDFPNIPAAAGWSAAESWAWSRVVADRTADFDTRKECNGLSVPDPGLNNAEDPRWRDNCREISAQFLQDLLTRSPWRDAVPVTGIRIAHARIIGDLNLSYETIPKSFQIFGSRYEGKLDLRRAHALGVIGVARSVVVGDLLADRLHAEDDLFLPAIFQRDVFFRGARINGDFSMVGARVGGGFFGHRVRVEGDLSVRDSIFGKYAALLFAHVGGNLEVCGAIFSTLDLAGATVGGDFRVGKSQLNCRATSKWGNLNLHNARVGGLPDGEDAWPALDIAFLQTGDMVLDGFTFDHFGVLENDARTIKHNENMLWWDNWARRDLKYNPALYAQLAAAKKSQGDNDAANNIRFLGRERARESVCLNAWSFDCLFQSTLRYSVGYGIGIQTLIALGWVFTLSLVSMAILKLTVPETQGERRSWLWCFGAGLSRLLPGVDLGKEFVDLFEGPFRPRFKLWQGTWFYFVRFAGFVLGAALIAAFAGLTQGG